jgi:hypothetical protein
MPLPPSGRRSSGKLIEAKDWVVAGAAEMSIECGAFLFTINFHAHLKVRAYDFNHRFATRTSAKILQLVSNQVVS